MTEMIKVNPKRAISQRDPFFIVQTALSPKVIKQLLDLLYLLIMINISKLSIFQYLNNLCKIMIDNKG